MSAFAVPPVAGIAGAPIAMQLGAPRPVASPATGDFGRMVMLGLEAVNAKLDRADAFVRQFAVDDSVPVHQVTMALEEARLSVELAMQVRSRLVEGYRELMNMQL